MIIEKLKSNAFSPLSVLEMDMVVDTVCPINDDETKVVKSESVVKAIEEVITSGTHWELNPSCQIFIKDGVFDFQKEILSDDIVEKSDIIIEEMDIHRNIVQVVYTVKLVLINARTLPDELILKSKFHTIHTPFGKIYL